jgi:hypothetical protein
MSKIIKLKLKSFARCLFYYIEQTSKQEFFYFKQYYKNLNICKYLDAI